MHLTCIECPRSKARSGAVCEIDELKIPPSKICRHAASIGNDYY